MYDIFRVEEGVEQVVARAIASLEDAIALLELCLFGEQPAVSVVKYRLVRVTI